MLPHWARNNGRPHTATKPYNCFATGHAMKEDSSLACGSGSIYWAIWPFPSRGSIDLFPRQSLSVRRHCGDGTPSFHIMEDETLSFASLLYWRNGDPGDLRFHPVCDGPWKESLPRWGFGFRTNSTI